MELHVFYDRRSYEHAIESMPSGLIVWVEERELVEWFDGDRHTGPVPVAYEFRW